MRAGHLQASACCKHFAANSVEKSTEAGATHSRHDFDADVTMQDLVDSFLPGFQSCVEKGRVSGLMCAYNAINGEASVRLPPSLPGAAPPFPP